jgi:phosphoglycerate dehydrogenase-like enzyme
MTARNSCLYCAGNVGKQTRGWACSWLGSLQGVQAMAAGPLVVVFGLNEVNRAVVEHALAGAAEVVSLKGLDDAAREAALRRAGAVLLWNTTELRPHELALIANARLLQTMSAGVDFLPFSTLPAGLPVASNGGAYAEPMAEHALAMALAAAKRLIVEHTALAAGAFNQFEQNRMLAGGVCGIFGFGGIGEATAKLMRALGMRIHAVNRRGATDAQVDWIGGVDRLPELLAASDVLLISAPLSRTTRGIIDAAALARMKPDAILVNLARGELIDEAALFAHLRAHPRFTACIDAWWIEPGRHGRFAMEQPFMTLPNVIGSPHNSATVASSRGAGLRRAAENCRRALVGETPHYLVREDEKLL